MFSEYAVRNRSRITQVIIVCLFWIIFCIIGALLILKQMAAVNEEIAIGEEEEDLDTAWFLFWMTTCIAVPFIAGFGNIIQWEMYKRWIIKGGSIVSQTEKVPPNIVRPEELHNDDEGGFSLFT